LIRVTNGRLTLACDPHSGQLTVRDESRDISWRLDERTRTYCRKPGDPPEPLGKGTFAAAGQSAIQETFDLGSIEISILWELMDDCVAVTLDADGAQGCLFAVSLPGSFVPEGAKVSLAIPVMQGLAYDGRGEAFESTLAYGGHYGLSMAMLGYLTDGAGLLLSVETSTDWFCSVGKRESGSPFASVSQTASLGRIGYPRVVRLYPCDGSVTALCKRYRRRVQERGGWKPWDEKIAERPAVARLFGALMAFIGYNQGPFDYPSECRKLLDAGFDRAFLYPVRFNAYARDFKMGGDPPIDLSDQDIHAIAALGYDVSPWTWVVEALDDGSEEAARAYLRDASGQKVPHWQIDDYQWYLCCTPSQADFVKKSYAGRMRDMTWAHFDVNATAGPRECYALDHPRHSGHALDRRADLAFLRELLGPETNGNRIVSSEGVRDALADVYDIGTTKLLPAFGDVPFWTVPMTMLVYHDALIHDWWEVHNYNAAGGFDHVARWGHKCDGFPKDKAAMDALYGCPPNVFPFGKQYRWVDLATRETESYTVRFEDPAVQEALSCALPVAQLHRRIGMLEMCEHAFLSEDGAVQATAFSDGTRVVPNLGDTEEYVDGFGLMPAKSWEHTQMRSGSQW